MSSSYGINFGGGATVTLLWTDFKAIVLSKSLDIQYFDNSVSYTIFAMDGTAILYECLIYKASTEAGATYKSDYSHAQNTTDRTDFETYYKPSANAPYKFTIQQTSGYYPQALDAHTEPTPALVDRGGALLTRGSTTTDEGSFYDDFQGSSLLSGLTGTLTVVNGSVTVTGSGTLFKTEVNRGDYIKITSQGETALTVVDYVLSDTELVLLTGYAGASTSGAASRSNWYTSTPSGSSITVSGGTLTVTSGTTNGNTVYVARRIDFAPLAFRFLINLSQRIANQTTIIGFVDNPANIQAQAAVVLDGTDNSKVKFRTSQTSGEVEETTILLPNNLTTANSVVVSMVFDVAFVKCAIAGSILFQHVQHIPAPYQVLHLATVMTNSATVTTTNLNVPVVELQNYDSVIIRADQGIPAGDTLAWPVKIVTSPYGTNMQLGGEGRLRVGLETQVIYDPVENANINTNIWTQSTSVMTQALSNATISLNSGGSLASGAYSILSSSKRAYLLQDFGLFAHFRAKIIQQTNAINEIGFGKVATTAAPTDGVFFRFTATTIYGVLNFNGTETLSTPLAVSIDAATFYSFNIYIYEDYAVFQINTPTGVAIVNTTLSVPSGQPSVTMSSHLSFFGRVYNTGVTSSAADIGIGIVSVQQTDIATNKSWAEQLVGQQRGAYTDPVAYTQTANYSNSAAPSTATLSNTTPSYTTLGGQFQFAAIAGAETDYALFGFQVPNGNQLIITNVKIHSFITGAQSTGSATILQWGLGINSSGASLATGGSNPPMRLALGMQSAPKTASIGDSLDPEIVAAPEVPFAIDPGRYFHIILKVVLGNATASQIIRGTCLVEGYFE